MFIPNNCLKNLLGYEMKSWVKNVVDIVNMDFRWIFGKLFTMQSWPKWIQELDAEPAEAECYDDSIL